MIDFIRNWFKRKPSLESIIKYKGFYNINEMGHWEDTFLEEYGSFDMYLRRQITNIKIDKIIGLENKFTLKQIDTIRYIANKMIDDYELKYYKDARYYSGIMFGQFYWNGGRLE